MRRVLSWLGEMIGINHEFTEINNSKSFNSQCKSEMKKNCNPDRRLTDYLISNKFRHTW